VIICKNCGRENEDEYKFCLGCGSALPKAEEAPQEESGPKMVDCSHCGTAVPSNFKFCGACGGAISAREEPVKAASPPSQPAEPEQASKPAPAAQPASPSPVPAGTQAPSAGEDVVGRLIVIRPDGSEGPEIPLTSGEHTVGRDSDKKALSNDPFLSPTHATFSFTGEGFRVRDEGSLNGVFVRIREKIELEHGDMVRLGQELIRFELLSELDSVLDDGTDGTKVGGSPGDNYWGRLCLVAGPDIVSRAFALGGEAVTLGRESGDILFRDDGFVSGKHARVSRQGDKAVLEDLGSSNGTYRRIQAEIHVDDGDLLLMGQQLFRLAVI
jgi:pSer/pThr/pTyr-binding forkhead associated (FHA) protein/RNA polymerase subunit RPABC4/transcription elongation factor Spt4